MLNSPMIILAVTGGTDRPSPTFVIAALLIFGAVVALGSLIRRR